MGRPIGPDLRIRALNGSRTAHGATHGTRSTYVYHGCRCDPCRDAEAAYSRLRYRKRKAA